MLASLGHMIAERTRVSDLACRMGDDEFAILFGETDAEGAMEAVERLLVELEDVEVGPVRGIPVAVGLAALQPGQRPEDLLAAAGSALEEARASGGRQAALYAGDHGDETPKLGQGSVIAALASALEERDRYTGEHSESVVDLAARVGESLGLGGEEIEHVRTAALLHDIGKVGVPDEILHKPARLDEREWEIVRQHPVIGERILRAIPGFGYVAGSCGTSTSAGTGWLSGRPGRHQDSDWQPDHPGVRRVPRHDLRPAIPQGDAARQRHVGADAERRVAIRSGCRAGAGRLPLRPPPSGVGDGVAASDDQHEAARQASAGCSTVVSRMRRVARLGRRRRQRFLKGDQRCQPATA